MIKKYIYILQFVDQDTFNVVLKENVKYLPPFYNFILAFLSWDLKEIADYYKIAMAILNMNGQRTL